MVKTTIGEIHVDSCGIDAVFVEESKEFDGLKVVSKFKLNVILKSGVKIVAYESLEKGNCLNLIPKEFGVLKKGLL